MNGETQAETIEGYRYHLRRMFVLWDDYQKTPNTKTLKMYHKEIVRFASYAVALSSRWKMTQEQIQEIEL